jgi:diguanylate cyclase (GGDEF)-like protein/PAS domain S-box-containing protein
MLSLKPFRDWSIRHKLTGLFIAMACIAAMTVSVPMGIFDLLHVKRAMARDLATLADVLGRNSTAAVAFRDAAAARDVLQALQAEPSVTAACIYTEDRRPLASYVRQGAESAVIPPRAEPPVTRFTARQLIVFRDIVLSDELVGTIYIAADLQQLDTRLRQYTLAFFVMLGITLSMAFVIASRLQRPISQPLADLVRTSEQVSSAGDYTVRAQLPNRDELGLLVSAFNGMLDQIEKRDLQLRQHREELEQKVASRTEELLNANLQLRQAEEKYRAIFEDAVIGILQTTPEGRPLRINRALAAMHGYDSPEQLLAEVTDVARQLFVNTEQLSQLRSLLERDGIVRSAVVELYRRDGIKKWGLVNLRAVRNPAGEIILHEGTVEDITDRKRAEEQVQFLAYYDALTGLPNRTLLRDRLEQALASARRRSEKVALLFLDLDRFKIINDSLGHSVGDLLLQEVAERLKHWGREQDTVARIGGDEFLIVLTAIKDVPDAAVAAERIMDAMTTPFAVQGRSFTVSCSVGISIFPEHGHDSETLIKNADAAMYCAKEAGRNQFQFFTDDMNAQVVERLTLEHSLRLGLEREELFLVYQPQADIARDRIVGVEALLRWQHPELGLVSPERFVRVAENSGLIIPIGEWVLRTACSVARKWQDEGLLAVPVAVNVSAVQFRQDGFRELIRTVLRETGLAPQYLELELTESLLLSNADVTLPLLRDLKAMGVKLAIDDFGTGYSSLSYLRQFPVNRIKVDRSFIQSVAVNSDDAAITTAIISMAGSLNLRVIAEGVENESQMSFLRAHHCDEIQGYYYSRPLTVDELFAKLRSIATKSTSAGEPLLGATKEMS